MSGPDIRTSTRSEWLPCELDAGELRDRGDDLAGVVQDVAAETDRQTDQKAQMKARLMELESRKTQLAITISRREEHRDVPVVVTVDYALGVETRTRTDTGEVIGTRALREDEKQPDLPGVADA